MISDLVYALKDYRDASAEKDWVYLESVCEALSTLSDHELNDVIKALGKVEAD